MSAAGRQTSDCEPGPSVLAVLQRTSVRPIPVRTASSCTRARRSRSKSTDAVSRPWTPGATVTNIGRSPANRALAPRTLSRVAFGAALSRASPTAGSAPKAAAAPAAARSKRRRVSPGRTATKP